MRLQSGLLNLCKAVIAREVFDCFRKRRAVRQEDSWLADVELAEKRI